MSENETKNTIEFSNLEQNVPQSLHPILEAVVKYKKPIIFGLAAVLVIAAAIGLFRWHHASTLQKAQHDLGKVLMSTEGQERVTRLEEILAESPSAMRPAVLLELGESCMQNGDYEKAAQYYDELSKEGDDAIVMVASLGEAKALMMSGKASEAYDVLKKLSGNAPESFTGTVYRQLAVSAEAAGNNAAALEAWQKLLENPTEDKEFVEYKIQQLTK